MKMNKRFIFLALFSVLSLQTVCYGMFPSFPDSQPNCFQKTTLEVLLEDKKFEWSTRWDSLRRRLEEAKNEESLCIIAHEMCGIKYIHPLEGSFLTEEYGIAIQDCHYRDFCGFRADCVMSLFSHELSRFEGSNDHPLQIGFKSLNGEYVKLSNLVEKAGWPGVCVEIPMIVKELELFGAKVESFLQEALALKWVSSDPEARTTFFESIHAHKISLASLRRKLTKASSCKAASSDFMAFAFAL